jgi:mycoredoxin
VTEDRDGMVVYWRPGCPYCMNLRLRLRFSGLTYTEVNIWRDPGAAALVRSVADGNETVPTVTVAGRAMVNPSTRQVVRAVTAHAPHLLSTKRPAKDH